VVVAAVELEAAAVAEEEGSRHREALGPRRQLDPALPQLGPALQLGPPLLRLDRARPPQPLAPAHPLLVQARLLRLLVRQQALATLLADGRPPGK
jgi:hypothetical protein